MPSALTYPGVYVEEIPSGVRSIAGVSTSVAAFVDYFRRGVVNKARRIFSFGDFEREFGGLDRLSESSYAIQQFFLNGGSEAWVVRCVGSLGAAAGATLFAADGSASVVLEAGRATRRNPGTWGNQLRIQVDPLPAAPPPQPLPQISVNRFNLTVLLVESRGGLEAVVQSEKFVGLTTAAGDPKNVQTVLNDENSGSKLVRLTQTPGADRPLANGTVSGSLATFPTLTTASPLLKVTIGSLAGTATLTPKPTSLAEARGKLESAIRAARPGSRAFSEATVQVVDNRLRILAGPTGAVNRVLVEAGGTDPTASNLGLTTVDTRNGQMSGDLASVNFTTLAAGPNLVVTVNIGGVATPPTLTLVAANMGTLAAARTEFENKLRAASGSVPAGSAAGYSNARVVAQAGTDPRLIVIAGAANATVAVAGTNASALKFDAPSNPAAAVTVVGSSLATPPAVAAGGRVAVTIGTTGPLNALLAAPPAGLPTQTQTNAAQLQAAIRGANAGFSTARVAAYEPAGQARLAVIAPAATALALAAAPTDLTTVSELRFTTAAGATSNIQLYVLGAGEPVAPAVTPIPGSAQGSSPAGTDVLPGANELIGDPTAKTGLQALEDADLFNLLCLPRAAVFAGSTDAAVVGSSQALLSNALTYCEKRRAILLVDTPVNRDEPEEITQWLASNSTLRSRNAALFYPRVKVPDPLDEFRLRSFGASGTVAGLFARIDSTRGVWKAPAGTEAVVRNVSELEDLLTDQENGALNPLAINCLRNFPIYGNVVWGARTLEGADQNASEWKYIPVRRVALFIEESLYRGLKWVVFEPNDEPLWSQIRLNVGAFMNNLFRQGAFQGTTPREAYFVKCDKETTTQNDINLGIVNIVVGFAPLKPAEFVVIKLQQMAGQIAT